MDLLYPPFASLVSLGLIAAKQNGLKVAVFESYRFPLRQGWLYSQGRTRAGKIVTNATAWKSWHQYGLAVDVVFFDRDDPSIIWDWEGDWTKLGTIFKNLGLEWLGDSATFPEKPHFQLPKGLSIQEAQSIYLKDGIMGVWFELENRR
jgi:peptidoglycan LD-endopeptidase CwlK